MFVHSWGVGSAPTAGSSAIGPDPWNGFQQPPLAPSPTAKANASIGGALMRSLGSFAVVLSGFLVLLAGFGSLADKGDALAITGAIVLFTASAAFWIGCLVWAHRRAGPGWTPAFVFFGIFTVAVYAFSVARYGRSTGRRPFPCFQSCTFLAAVGMILMVVAAFSGAYVNATKAAPAENSGQIALAAPSSTPKFIAAVVPTDIPSSTALPTDTPQPTTTPHSTQTPRPTVEPTETSTPKPTRTPKPKRTPKPQPTAARAAAFDPGWISRALLNEPVLNSDNPSLDNVRAEELSQYPSSAEAGIYMWVGFGGIADIVFNSDQEASDFVVSTRVRSVISLPNYPQYPTARYWSDDYSFFYVAVGNVVVWGCTSSALLYDSGYYTVSSDPDIMSAVLADYGVKRLLRIAGDAPAGGTIASDGSL